METRECEKRETIEEKLTGNALDNKRMYVLSNGCHKSFLDAVVLR